MPIGTAFHERTFQLCESLSYREWSGYYAVSSYEPHHEHEYNAIRNAAALIDISPLFKYRLTGKDATDMKLCLSMTKDELKAAPAFEPYQPPRPVSSEAPARPGGTTSPAPTVKQ